MIILDLLISCFHLKLVQVFSISFYYPNVNHELINLYELFVMLFIRGKQVQPNSFSKFEVYFNTQIFLYRIMMYFFVIRYFYILYYYYLNLVFSFIDLIDNLTIMFIIFFQFVFLFDLLII